MADTMKLEIVTPEDKIYSDDVNMVTLPGKEGQMGIFPNHVPLMTQVAAGEILAQKGSEQQYLAVGEGFVQITPDKISVLTDMAVAEDNIDEAKAEEAKKQAEARLQEKLSDEELATVKAALAHSIAQLSVKRKKRAS
ncbi:MAG: F0F1 ATP synthase subunit epsilon [Verrucomicrobiae bacterium]|jgi:F-type H+-transporting ATPase subunit epsilon|nr:ATP synthase F1 subunit epsilon [Pedosphaera sp.]MBL6842651.1 F0F1 ATP synthase subunit epsilon [Verrucomicrobiae bacterium]RZO73083.1 MAG: F0F1 ATP synthase subunit epsilon [Limisphaerales bacterium]HAR00751.1 ATP synthase F1 subunit epsilon [Verrucomicrobiales bacterium]HAW02826.1 ATP synthase F1 subunit epsilon [Verrucomicrobiales bacterium]|tara:strand:+ start:2460 stop:2873 length:414 start_codon:yes stop_codon:yes gene_type:complete